MAVRVSVGTPVAVLVFLGFVGCVGCVGCTGAREAGLDEPAPASVRYPGDAGGRLAALVFAVIGDTRPASIDDTAGYPNGVVEALFTGMAQANPRPAFVLATGDFMYASPWPRGAASQAAPQLDLYLAARARFPGAFFPALGNHECAGATSSNCGPGSADGVTANYAAFTEKMLAPLGLDRPYYAVDLAAPDGSWTAKLVLVAANAWSTDEERWLEATMARPTTYTFVVRHEPAADTGAPGVVPSERVLAAHPYTLAIVGHRHAYGYDPSTREVLVGNGGAPLEHGNYGFALFERQPDGAIAVDMIDWRTGAPDPSFHFAVGP